MYIKRPLNANVMAGKRLLDAAALVGAARSIAVQHAQIRAQQFDLLAKTSSMTKAFANRPTIGHSSNFATSQKFAAHPDVEGIQQDHHYTRSTENSTQNPVPEEDLDIKQRKADRFPLQDGSIPPSDAPIVPDDLNDEAQPNRPDFGEAVSPLADDGTYGGPAIQPTSSGRSSIPDPTEGEDPTYKSSEEAKRVQRQSEAQIPAQVAEPPTRAERIPSNDSESTEPEIFVDQERDTYYQASETASPVLSALPRVKLPKNTNDEQGGDSHLPQKINADTFYSSAEAKTEKEENPEVPEEVLQQIFHSPKAKQLLSKSGKSHYSPAGVTPKGTRGVHTLSRVGSTAAFSTNVRLAEKATAAHEEEEVKKLAADIAKDVEQVRLV